MVWPAGYWRVFEPLERRVRSVSPDDRSSDRPSSVASVNEGEGTGDDQEENSGDEEDECDSDEEELSDLDSSEDYDSDSTYVDSDSEDSEDGEVERPTAIVILQIPSLKREQLSGKRKSRTDDVNDDSAAATTRVLKKQRRSIECAICCSDLKMDKFPVLRHEGSVADEQSVCFTCWEKHISSTLLAKGWDVVKCLECDKLLDEVEIKKLASVETWLDKAAKAYREGDEEFRACPSASCSWGCFFFTNEDGNIFACQLCKYRWCVVCEVPMHEDQTCSAYQARVAREEKARREELAVQNTASEKLVGKSSKACPGCTARIEKISWCDHVRCRRCHHQFCWLCFAAYGGKGGILSEGNKAHEKSCKHYA
ncbi:uncharacterized protein LTR77_009114 [Saxophila tyrrhenica]|uniref:RBR-type E3 ubiquitin transferase n=1 Tax=Saxophila tyrrhenica TaxID=1690608 RepID=A0AAV9P0I4_9PEZI|nr:hypothetical protein LTR77_009114 [Saxophila tyrrhenica]